MPDTKHKNAHVDDASEIKDERHTHKHKFSSKRKKLEWYLDEIDCYKEDMGKWYTIFIRRVLPVLAFFLPLNNIVFYTYDILQRKFFGGVLPAREADTTIAFVAYIIALLVFIAILIFLPRFATFCEFVLAGMFYFYAARSVVWAANGLIKKELITTPLGYFAAIALGVFIFMKFVFLVIEIVYMITFRGEHEPKAYHGDENDIVF